MKAKDWAFILAAAAVMLATLPGRTQGLGLITEPLILDLRLDRVQFANINLWATLLGAFFCFPAGWLFDRFGLRWPTAGLIVLLAGTVCAFGMTGGSVALLLVLLTITRGAGQSALSIASITAVAKRFGNKAGMPMAMFSVSLSVFFAVAFGAVGYAVRMAGWRTAWLQVAAFLVAVILPAMLFVFPSGGSKSAGGEEGNEGLTLADALLTRSFWTFAGSAALFNFVSSGLGLFNESVLAERGFDQKMFHIFLAVTTLLSLLGQFMSGWLSTKMSYQKLTSSALAVYSAALILIPLISTRTGLFVVSALMGIAGGMIIVVFFAIWGEAFGRRQLGRIQGAAQCLTVVSSALGPVLFAKVFETSKSYTPLLLTVAVLVMVAALMALGTRLPRFSKSHVEPCTVG